MKRFTENTALLLIDIQKGVDVLEHWGGQTGRRNNPGAELHMKNLLSAWRQNSLPIVFTRHDSWEATSPLKWSLSTGDMKDGFEPTDGEVVIRKHANSSFVGTSLEIELRRLDVSRLVIIGFFTNFCVETTARMAGNLGYDTYLVHDACATTNRIGIDGTDYDPELVHDMSIANLDREFCTAIDHRQAMSLLSGDQDSVERAAK
ncbi:MAG: cysteine hydrolase [Gammaproteobacteria bacterium]|nr:MAG: cysteine hydrolase [Gammaproteobacteria bacterium]